MTFVNLNNAKRSEEYWRAIEKIKKDGVCPFCPENLQKYNKTPILREGNFWILTDNMYPYKGAKHHILLIHKKHIEHVQKISEEAWSELLELVELETKKRGIRGGTFYMRFGDTLHTGASVTHLHANIISADTDDKNREPIYARVG